MKPVISPLVVYWELVRGGADCSTGKTGSCWMLGGNFTSHAVAQK